MLFPFNLNDKVVGVIPNISANFACVIFDLAISVSKLKYTASLPFSNFRDYILKYTRSFEIVMVLSITRELGLDAEALVDGKICKSSAEPTTIAAHFDGDEYTEDELKVC